MTKYRGKHSKGGAISIRYVAPPDEVPVGMLTAYYQARTFITSVTGDTAQTIDAMRVNEFECVLTTAQKLFKDRWEMAAKMNPFIKAD